MSSVYLPGILSCNIPLNLPAKGSLNVSKLDSYKLLSVRVSMEFFLLQMNITHHIRTLPTEFEW